MTPEPILRSDDLRAWDTWMRAARVHARTRAHARRVDAARRIVERALEPSRSPAVSWSGGKDSTALAHLVVVDRGARHVEVFSEKDDLDFPGEEEFVRRLGAEWGARLTVLHPPVSPAQWIAEHTSALRAERMIAGDDIHSRAAGLSKACFYNVMREANRGHDLVMLGLRAEESRTRRYLRETRGTYYVLRSSETPGQRRALPIADWRGLDVYAYLESVGVEPLPLYRCIGLMHAEEPWRLRKSWWLPGAGSAYGQVVWLRRYYPSLYRQLVAWMPDARMMG